MNSFILRRLTQSLLVLLIMSFVIYALIGLMPGDPVDLMISADPEITAEDAARLKAIYGLDRPIVERYGAWLISALQGDFGFSRLYAEPVLDVLLPRLANSILLMSLAFLTAFGLALAAALWAAQKPGGWVDGAVNLLAFAGLSLPSFWLAILLIMLFAVNLSWLPAGGMGEGFWDRAHHLVLPVMALALASLGGHLRYLRAGLIETLDQDYIRTARAKGLSRWEVLWRHALRNALLPVVTILGLEFGTLFGGALITETIFSYLGMGKTLYDAILGNDYNLALVGLLLATATVLIGNLLADCAYAWLDPRIEGS